MRAARISSRLQARARIWRASGLPRTTTMASSSPALACMARRRSSPRRTSIFSPAASASDRARRCRKCSRRRIASGVASVFGGTSVLACAADRLALLPGTRFGLSGPKVLESVHGKWELDADDARDVDAVFGAQSRNAAGLVELVFDDVETVRAWVAHAIREREDFTATVVATHARLGARIAGEAAHAPA